MTALYDFAGEVANDELVFNAGDSIQVLEEVNEEWLKGKCKGRTGMFPKTFVDLNELNKTIPYPTESPSQDDHVTSHVNGPRCTALFDYNADTADDLSFKVGDVIELKRRVSAEWLEGTMRGRTGTFPAAFVEIVEDLAPNPTEPGEVRKN